MNPYHIGVVTALIAYAISSIFYTLSFAPSEERVKQQRIGFWFFVIATFFTTFATISVINMNPEQIVSVFILISSISWITVIGKSIFDFRMIGAFVAPLSTIILLAQFLFVAPHGPAQTEGPSALMYAHIVTSVLGEAFAIIACVIAVLYLMQQRAMKSKQLDLLQATQMPISKLSKALQTSLWAGFVLLTSGLIMGAVYTQFFMVGDRESLMGKIIWAFGVWLWYLATLVGKNLMNLPAKKLAWMTIIGFALMALGLFGTTNWSSLVG